MIQKAVRALALLPCAVAMLGSALQASPVKSEKFEIPFSFQVYKNTTLPAGEYQVQQAAGSEIVALVNTRTGQQVHFLRSPNTHETGKAKLEFEGHTLKHIS